MNVLLDLDGTLTDPKRGIVGSIQHALRALGRDVPEESALLKYIGPPLREIFRELLGEDRDTEHAVAAYRERFVAIGMFENSVYADIPEALKLLREGGARLFVATSKPQIYAQRIIDHFGLGHFFEEVYGCDMDGTLADKADLIAHVLSVSRLNRAHTTMVGDRHHDIVGAMANGVRAVGVLWGYGSREELSLAGAEALLETPGKLATLAYDNVLQVPTP